MQPKIVKRFSSTDMINRLNIERLFQQAKL